MKNIITLTVLVLLTYTSFGQAPFQILYPTNNSITNPVMMSSYSDTANGKIIMNGWPYTGNFVINSINISNNNYPCGRSYPFPASKMIYLNELFTGAGYTLCYASGPLPDTLLYFFANPVDSFFTDSLYFVVGGGGFPTGTKDYDKEKAKIYPNPAGNNIVVSTAVPGTNLTIYSLSGKAILRKTGIDNFTSIDISSLSSGTYFVTTIDPSGNRQHAKLQKE